LDCEANDKIITYAKQEKMRGSFNNFFMLALFEVWPKALLANVKGSAKFIRHYREVAEILSQQTNTSSKGADQYFP